MAARHAKQFRVSCIQIDAGSDWKKNLVRSLKLAEAAARKKPDLISFPENFIYRGSKEGLREIAEKAFSETVRIFADFARHYGIALILGSLIEKTSKPSKFFNSSVILDDQGQIAARYKKIHLFDVQLPRLKSRESKYFLHGSAVTLARFSGVRLGLSICFDLRFPELYRRLTFQGAQILAVPANFTYETGKAHWEILLRARAIENQAFVIAPAQVGVSPGTGIRSFGRSLVVDPWGRVLGALDSKKEGILTVDLDLGAQKSLRKRFPVLKAAKLSSLP